MRTAIMTFLALLAGILTAQSNFSSANFEAEALAYSPEQRPGVTDRAFEFGKMVLEETVRQTDNNPKGFNRADYFNVLSGLISLQEPKESILLAWRKFLASEGSCEYLIDDRFEDDFLGKLKLDYLKDAWKAAEADCRASGEGEIALINPTKYATGNGLDAELVRLIDKINKDDQRYRKNGYTPEKQIPLDRENEHLIDQLYARYGTYLGTSLVGKQYDSVMWAVIQHSRPETMKKYLPVVHRAVTDGELPEAPLRMLIDRVQTEETGKQVFGSQVGVPLLPEAERRKISEQYGIN